LSTRSGHQQLHLIVLGLDRLYALLHRSCHARSIQLNELEICKLLEEGRATNDSLDGWSRFITRSFKPCKSSRTSSLASTGKEGLGGAAEAEIFRSELPADDCWRGAIFGSTIAKDEHKLIRC